MTSMSLLALPLRNKARTALFALLVACLLLLAACGGGTTTSSRSNGKTVLRVAAQSYDFAQTGFNPYNAHPNAGIGLIYETLYFVNVNGGAFTPMLASSYQWNSDNTQLTFNLRQNVKWNDGQSFTADDVAYTFNAMKQYPAADTQGVWQYL
ncbi:MAG TPA: ABC transporter substrate-binding protein, partial [Ktedonobacteraceae bacterium]|nr:ABC transporter substrate-binding protein [Ktedonobacteraceae bacterium]